MQKQSFADVLQNGFKIGDLKRFANFTGKHRRWSLFLNNLQASCNFVKKRLQHRTFPVNFAKFPKTPFLQNTSRRLLLYAYVFMRISLFVELYLRLFTVTVNDYLHICNFFILCLFYLFILSSPY